MIKNIHTFTSQPHLTIVVLIMYPHDEPLNIVCCIVCTSANGKDNISADKSTFERTTERKEMTRTFSHYLIGLNPFTNKNENSLKISVFLRIEGLFSSPNTYC